MRVGDYFAIAGRRHRSEMVDETAIRWSRIHRRQHSERLQVPRILVVVVVPGDVASWVRATEEELVLRHCGY